MSDGSPIERGKPITEMTSEEAFAWIREMAPSAGEVTYAPDPLHGESVIRLRGATEKDARRLRNALALWSPLIGKGWKVEVLPALPHIYFWQGRWWVTRNGPANWRRGVTLNDNERPTFAEACQLAQLAAIYSGAWRP